MPYVRGWHDRYASDGLRVISIHAPGFEPSRDEDDVRDALFASDWIRECRVAAWLELTDGSADRSHDGKRRLRAIDDHRLRRDGRCQHQSAE